MTALAQGNAPAQQLDEPDIPAVAMDAVKSYYTGSGPIRSFRDYLSGVDMKRVMSDLGKDALSGNHTQNVEGPPPLEAAADEVPPLPPPRTEPKPPSALRMQVRQGLIASLLGG